jgi:hypothetical protein
MIVIFMACMYISAIKHQNLVHFRKFLSAGFGRYFVRNSSKIGLEYFRQKQSHVHTYVHTLNLLTSRTNLAEMSSFSPYLFPSGGIRSHDP